MARIETLKPKSDIIEFFQSYNIPYTAEYTNSTTYLERAGKKYILTDGDVSMKDLNFISRVKKYATATNKPKREITAKNVNYFSYQTIPSGINYNVMEIDVNKAYWDIALKFGYINESLYKEGLKVDKMTRLIALGSMATNKRCYRFDGQEERYEGDKVNHVTRSYFFHIAKYLGDIMEEVCDEVGAENIYFYWVDAFFVRSVAQEAITAAFERRGLKVKYVELAYINVVDYDEYHKRIYALEIKKRQSDRTFFSLKPFIHVIKEKRPEYVSKKFKESVLKAFQ